MQMRKRSMVLALMGCLAGLVPLTAQATSGQRAGRGRARKAPVDKGPAETRDERERRLQRECRGRPSSGACEGYGG